MITEIINKAEFQKKLLWFNGAIPGFLLCLDWVNGNLGANPPEALIRSTGVLSIIFLLLCLAITPMTLIMNWTWPIKLRRWTGGFSFFYALIHLLAYALFDKALGFSEIYTDLQKRPFILLGFSSFLLMLPLAITSSNSMIKHLGGRRWKNLHKLVYLAAILSVVHYWMIAKSDIFYPAIAGGILIVLLVFRLIFRFTRLSTW